MTNILKIVIIIFLCSNAFSQEQIGEDILGINPNDEFGSGVSINESGDIIAIGIHRRNSQTGAVEVYQKINNQWAIMGDIINGQIDNQWFGTSVDLSSDGQRIIVGCVYKNIAYIYDFIDSNWQNTSQIEFGMGLISFGRSVSISKDGNIIAIAATHYPQSNIHRGIVNIYRQLNNQWIQVGEGIGGEFDKDVSGWDINLSENGNTIAIGSISNSNSGEDAGQVRIFINENNGWNQIGESLYGEHEHLSFGWSLDMSENGKNLIVGAPLDWTGIETENHYAQIFEFANGDWNQKGSKIYGHEGLNLGYDVAISDDGDRVAISIPQHEDCPIQIYDFIESDWELVGSITHEAEFHTLGFSLDLNPAGDILVGTSRTSNGIAVVYDISELETSNCLKVEQPEEVEETDSLIFYLPNIISQNSNNVENSILFGQSSIDTEYSLYVFDRWGNLIFHNENATTNSMEDGWRPDDRLLQGVYVYIIKYKNKAKEIIISKYITVIE